MASSSEPFPAPRHPWTSKTPHPLLQFAPWEGFLTAQFPDELFEGVGPPSAGRQRPLESEGPPCGPLESEGQPGPGLPAPVEAAASLSERKGLQDFQLWPSCIQGDVHKIETGKSSSKKEVGNRASFFSKKEE